MCAAMAGHNLLDDDGRTFREGFRVFRRRTTACQLLASQAVEHFGKTRLVVVVYTDARSL